MRLEVTSKRYFNVNERKHYIFSPNVTLKRISYSKPAMAPFQITCKKRCTGLVDVMRCMYWYVADRVTRRWLTANPYRINSWASWRAPQAFYNEGYVERLGEGHSLRVNAGKELEKEVFGNLIEKKRECISKEELTYYIFQVERKTCEFNWY